MEISDFKELFNYNHTVRQNYIDAFKQKLSWEDMIKNRETGWLSLKDTLLHIIWLEDSWINYSIQGLEDPNRPFPYSSYNSWNIIDDYDLNSTSKINKKGTIMTTICHSGCGKGICRSALEHPWRQVNMTYCACLGRSSNTSSNTKRKKDTVVNGEPSERFCPFSGGLV